MLFDFWTGAIGRVLEAGTALALFENVSGSAGVAVVGTVTLFWLLGPLLASAALTFEPLLYAGFALVGAVPLVLVGLRMIQRNRAEAAAAA